MPYYAVRKGFSTGVFNTWDECKAQVHKFAGAQYKKFPTYDEALAFVGKSPVCAAPAGHSSTSCEPPVAVGPPLAGYGHQPAAGAERTRGSGAAPAGQPYPTAAAAAATGRQRSSAASRRVRPQPVTQLTSAAAAGAPGAESASASQLEDMQRCMARVRRELATLQRTAARLNSSRTPAGGGAVTGASTTSTSSSSSGGGTGSSADAIDFDFEDDDLWGDDAELLAAVDEADPPPAAPPTAAGPDQFIVDAAGYLHVWTDGACTSNGHRHAQAGLGVWFNRAHRLNISQPVDGPATNNNAEIQAAWMALEVAAAAGHRRVQLHTDSQFLINCATRWVHRWRHNGWRLSGGGSVKNRTQLEALLRAMKEVDVKWNYVKGHAGVEGNEGADQLAVEGARRYKAS